jgi:hypothetical protein
MKCTRIGRKRCNCSCFQIDVVCPFVPFLLAIVLYVILPFTDSDYPLNSSFRHEPCAKPFVQNSFNLCTNRAKFELATLVVICTDCIGSSKFNYHMITTLCMDKRLWQKHRTSQHVHNQLDRACRLFSNVIGAQVKRTLDERFCITEYIWTL